jgi:hypothetical protein
MMEELHYYLDRGAAHILKISPKRFHQMRRDGELEGISPEENRGREWKSSVSPP